MKALSLTEPMAWAIFHGKDVENRRWKTKFRGRIYIHASKKFDQGHYTFMWLRMQHLKITEGIPAPADFIHGALIGEVDIVRCEFYPPDDLPRLHSAWAMPGQYQFVLANPVEYETPIPCKGALSFFEPVLTGGMS